MIGDYDILGVTSAASDEEIKEAYRMLVKKLHPDQYANNPLSDIAEEKLKQVNAAYERINAERERQRLEQRKKAESSSDNQDKSEKHSQPITHIHIIYTDKKANVSGSHVAIVILLVLLRILAAPLALIVLFLSLLTSFITSIAGWIAAVPGVILGLFGLILLAFNFHVGTQEISEYLDGVKCLFYGFGLTMIPGLAYLAANGLATLSGILMGFVLSGKLL